MLVRDVMTSPVITAPPTATVKEAARLLLDNDIGGIPIVDEDGSLLGIVGESDLVPKEVALPFSRVTVPTLFKKIVSAGEMDLDELYRDMQGTTVDQVMEKDVYYVQAGDDVGRAASIMAHHDVKRLPVLENGKVVGIVARTDLIRILAESKARDEDEPDPS